MFSADCAKPVKNPEKPHTDHVTTKDKINVLKFRIVNLFCSCKERIVITQENIKNLKQIKIFNAETVTRHPKLCKPMQLFNFKD